MLYNAHNNPIMRTFAWLVQDGAEARCAALADGGGGGGWAKRNLHLRFRLALLLHKRCVDLRLPATNESFSCVPLCLKDSL